jgi:hypothetical protein
MLDSFEIVHHEVRQGHVLVVGRLTEEASRRWPSAAAR